ncbi:hypothetical protein [Bacillus sp. SA1-12]|uniref:hypothetical protein n=1 Tax=Bacillus sp. SA1-12 TaxID=1455638 RepID=UPI0006963041|nr:hypothetical protein [Bacillus sp. SA1-12]
MIKIIDIRNRNNAEDVLNIQITSYKVEAEIIGSYEIPPLKDTIYTLQLCGETLFGYYIVAMRIFEEIFRRILCKRNIEIGKVYFYISIFLVIKIQQ